MFYFLLRYKHYLKIALLFFIGTIIWHLPHPQEVSTQAWHLFSVFLMTIVSVLTGVLTIFIASIIGLVVVIFTNTLTVEVAYSGFSQSIILLIVAAFLVANAVVKSGLGKRIALIFIRTFGNSSLGLGYSMVLTDILIAPAFPSNTARSGLLYPIAQSLAHDSGSHTCDGTRKIIGSYLMMTSMAGISLSAGLWLTAMAANPIGVSIAQAFGIHISFFSWFLAASVPSFVAIIIAPYFIYKIYPPEKKKTPEAPLKAKEELKKMGNMSTHEKITLFTFIVMVILWVFSDYIGVDKAAIAFAGLAVLMVTGVFTKEDMRKQGDALSTLIWFSILYTMSNALNDMGFMEYLGNLTAAHVVDFSWPVVYIILVLLYIFIHYLFVSQTAQLLALFGVFLKVGISVGIPGELLALMLLFATNFSSVITPQGSSANVLFVSSEYMSSSEMYKNGLLLTILYTAIFMSIGTFWILLIT